MKNKPIPETINTNEFNTVFFIGQKFLNGDQISMISFGKGDPEMIVHGLIACIQESPEIKNLILEAIIKNDKTIIHQVRNN